MSPVFDIHNINSNSVLALSMVFLQVLTMIKDSKVKIFYFYHWAPGFSEQSYILNPGYIKTSGPTLPIFKVSVQKSAKGGNIQVEIFQKIGIIFNLFFWELLSVDYFKEKYKDELGLYYRKSRFFKIIF